MSKDVFPTLPTFPRYFLGGKKARRFRRCILPAFVNDDWCVDISSVSLEISDVRLDMSSVSLHIENVRLDQGKSQPLLRNCRLENENGSLDIERSSTRRGSGASIEARGFILEAVFLNVVTNVSDTEAAFLIREATRAVSEAQRFDTEATRERSEAQRFNTEATRVILRGFGLRMLPWAHRTMTDPLFSMTDSLFSMTDLLFAMTDYLFSMTNSFYSMTDSHCSLQHLECSITTSTPR